MTRAKSAGLLALAATFVMYATPSRAQQRDFSKVEMKVIPVSGNIYMLEGSGGNIGVSAGPDGVLIVDDEFAPLADKIREALKGINPGKLRFVLNTHFHGDHTGSNPVFGVDSTIIAHENVRKRLESGSTVMGNKTEPMAAAGLPVITYADAVSVHFNGEEIKAMHVPHSHTDGDSIIFFTKSNVVHMGDDFFNGLFPFVDTDSGGSVQGLTDAVAKVLAQVPADAKIIPGHGPLSDVAGLKKFHRMLVETTAIVRKGKAAGKTLEQLQAAGLPDEWKSWSSFIDTKGWIGTIYKSLDGAQKAPAAKKTPATPKHH
ncbi:MAG TPA: MBL fold metallo-hydrolase [Thermoanaerobaculia bacterium]|jgi:glyoxylase-like metal-dependent hydrolase (beta-lactamase superfamily II)|nr:MBL fold metallo-hydrolase [Thermoanaerobaculia bacterium]